MIMREELLAMDESEIPWRASALTADDIRMLVQLLDEKADVLRYHALLLLKSRSLACGDVYPYIDVFIGKLMSANSYQRSIGAILTAANAQWDEKNRIDSSINDCLALLQDEKPITIRQCLQALPNIIRHKHALRGVIAQRLLAFDLSRVKETMRKSVLMDILAAIAELMRCELSAELEAYFRDALAGGLLDKKAVKEAESLLKNNG